MVLDKMKILRRTYGALKNQSGTFFQDPTSALVFYWPMLPRLVDSWG